MEFSEKFIEKNIAELCKLYDQIKGANTNLARIAPELIDGLKPVQRRALYIMFLKDQGKPWRKLASISGDTFGRVHPHSPVSIENAIVGIEQPWHNSIPLIEGKGNWGCHDDKTEVLTRNGWKLFKDVLNTDLLASVDPLTGVMIFELPSKLFSYNYNGDLIIGKHKSVDFAVTPNHRMLIKQYHHKKRSFDEEFHFVNAESLPGYSSLMNNIHYDNNEANDIVLKEEKISNGNILPEMNISMDTWVQFLGIYLSDGCMLIDESNKYPYKLIHLSVKTKARKKMYYRDILRDMGFNYEWNEKKGGFIIINKRIWNMLESYGLFKKKAIDKFIPDFIFDLDHSYIEKFLYAFSMGDGSYESWNTNSYYTSSKIMADQLQILLLMCGKMSKIQVREPRESYINGRRICSVNNQYRIYEWKGKGQSIDRSRHLSTTKYEGKVYCAEVPTYHTLITRRNGCILISGNSISGDEAGASRYIYARLSDYAYDCFFSDWKNSVVDMVMGADEETKEPVYLPAKYPNALLNGCLGIGYGMASNIPPFNFKDVVHATIQLMTDPDANIVLIPDSPTGADIIEGDFAKVCDRGNGKYSMRCKYDINAEHNIIKITNLPYMVTANDIRSNIADIKEKNGLPELIGMNDLSGKEVAIELIIRDDVNPYKFMKKLISEVTGLEKSYPINITVTNDYQSFDYSIKKLLTEWIHWCREDKRVMFSHKRTTLLADQRMNDAMLFILEGEKLDETIQLFRSSRNRAEIEKKLIERYKNTPIHLDSIQAKTISMMRMYELSEETYEECIKRRDELAKDIQEVEDILASDNGIDKEIIATLREGVKKFGTDRKSNVVPYKISASSEVSGACILQLSSDGMIVRKIATNVYEEPVPKDTNGFAVWVDNDSSFVIIDENGYHTFVRVKDLPIDQEVPVNRYGRNNISGNIVAMLPFDIDSNKCCTLISRKGLLKRIRISDLKPSKKPFVELGDNDRLVRGIVTLVQSQKDLLIYTKDGMGQRFDPNSVRITSPSAKGGNGFKLKGDDEIIGCYAINPEENQYLLYVTTKGKMRLNLIDYLPIRDSKHDSMVRLISLNDRDKLVSIIGCNKHDKVQVYFDDGDTQVIDISKMEESTMSSEPKKMTNKNAVSTNIVKVRLL